MPGYLRWNWCNDNRNKVHNKCNVLESSPNHPLLPSLGKSCLPQNQSLVPKMLVTAANSLDLCSLPLNKQINLMGRPSLTVHCTLNPVKRHLGLVKLWEGSHLDVPPRQSLFKLFQPRRMQLSRRFWTPRTQSSSTRPPWSLTSSSPSRGSLSIRFCWRSFLLWRTRRARNTTIWMVSHEPLGTAPSSHLSRAFN